VRPIECRKHQSHMKTFYVYILASKSRTLYTGVTNNLEVRVVQHRSKLQKGFTERYNINRLVYYEVFSDIREAIRREKHIKGWLRMKKIALIESMNRDWKDLSDGWPGSPAAKPIRGKRTERDSSIAAAISAETHLGTS
jgi:putative endonuclease